jgi:hypothetical protein
MTIAKARRAQTRVAYGDDVLLWSKQQAQALRDARFADLDIEHLADEIEDVGKAEKRERGGVCRQGDGTTRGRISRRPAVAVRKSMRARFLARLRQARKDAKSPGFRGLNPTSRSKAV